MWEGAGTGPHTPDQWFCNVLQHVGLFLSSISPTFAGPCMTTVACIREYTVTRNSSTISIFRSEMNRVIYIYIYIIYLFIYFFFFLHSWFRASSLNINKIQQDATVCRLFIYCKITLHVSGVRVHWVYLFWFL